MLPAIIAIGVLTTIAFLIVRVKKGGLPAMFCKAGASLCFIGTAFAAFSYNREFFDYGVLVIFGLIFSLLGDIWLDLKYVYEEHKDLYLYSGFICFMCGHSLFIPAIAIGYESYKWWYFVLAAAVSAVTALAMILLEKPMKQDFGKFRKITALYTFFVTMTLMTSAIGMILNGFTFKYILLTVGAAAFALSDAVLSVIYFKKGGNTKVNVTVNHTLYYFAQFAIASTILL